MYVNKINNDNKYFEQVESILNYSQEKIHFIKSYKKRTGFLKNSNSKLGKNIYAFDLPAVVSCPDYKGKKILNYGTYESLKPIAKSIKGLICPITKGAATNNQKLKDLTCSICKYCITKQKPLFVQH